MVPRWDPTKCIQCNTCSYVCPHATIRPVAMTKEAAAAPGHAYHRPQLPKGTGYKFTIAVSPLDCMGCNNWLPCALRATSRRAAPSRWCPRRPRPIRQRSGLRRQQGHREERSSPAMPTSRAFQFHKPLLEFSVPCAGCTETSYARLVTQLFGDRMFISTPPAAPPFGATSAGHLPYTTNAGGHGPARGTTRCSRTTPSTALVWRLATRPSVTALWP